MSPLFPIRPSTKDHVSFYFWYLLPSLLSHATLALSSEQNHEDTSQGEGGQSDSLSKTRRGRVFSFSLFAYISNSSKRNEIVPRSKARRSMALAVHMPFPLRCAPSHFTAFRWFPLLLFIWKVKISEGQKLWKSRIFGAVIQFLIRWEQPEKVLKFRID